MERDGSWIGSIKEDCSNNTERMMGTSILTVEEEVIGSETEKLD